MHDRDPSVKGAKSQPAQQRFKCLDMHDREPDVKCEKSQPKP